jgi:hypothetical protein
MTRSPENPKPLAWAVVGALVGMVVAAEPPSRPREPHTLLGNHLGFGAAELQDLERGRPIKRSLAPSDPREIALAGAVRLEVPRAYFLDRFRDIVDFKRAPRVLQVGRFSDPPRLEDVRSLTLPDTEVEDLRRCRVGDCNVKLPASVIRRLETEVDWSQPDAREQVTRIVRGMLVDRARAYLRGGPAALEPDAARRSPVVPSRELAAILDASPYLVPYAPELRSVLEAFPRIGLPASEHFLYWSKETFELKPVISVTHVALYTPERLDGTMTIIASAGLYASHYLDASLGLTLVVDAAAGREGCYVVYVNRSRVDALQGFLSGVRRALAERRARSGTEESLLFLKARLETDYRAGGGTALTEPTAGAPPRR